MGSTTGNFVEFLARSRTLVAGTCVGIGSWHAGITGNIYDWVVIDEAARASPTELAVALQLGRRVLLVGDHEQLPPMYTEGLKKEAATRLNVSSASRAFISDFERVFDAAVERGYGAVLRTQYRMAPSIGQLISSCFYDERLVTGRGNPDAFFETLASPFDREAIWLDTSSAGREAREQRSEDRKDTWNLYEARVVIHVLKLILTNSEFVKRLSDQLKQDETPIGVICMYSAHCRRIEKLLADSDWLGHHRRLVKVDTVDGYQGKENRIVIVSLVRNNDSFDQGFLSAKFRANVAMSRAMDRLVVVGAANMWKGKLRESPLGRVVSYMASNTGSSSVGFASAKDFLAMEFEP